MKTEASLGFVRHRFCKSCINEQTNIKETKLNLPDERRGLRLSTILLWLYKDLLH